MPEVVVAGALANKPHNGGEAWVRLSWVRGLQAVGCEVRLLELIDPRTCADTQGRPSEVEGSANAAWFADVTAQFGLSATATLVDASQPPPPHVVEQLSAADLLVNISGHVADPALLGLARRRAYVDIDPGFTQFWHVQGLLGDTLDRHDLHFTIGERIGLPDCPVPTAGLRWRPVRQPLLLDDWPVQPPPESLRFTTVANWRGPFGPLEVDGNVYGLKVHEFRKHLDLPTLVDAPFELALGIAPADDADRRSLVEHRWQLVDPVAASGTPDAFRRYVQGSGAEFSVAQGMYVDTRCGWFSDRTTRYLASGRPALVQDTGFSDSLAAGTGLVGFSSLAEAVEGAKAIGADPDAHAAAAREVAQTCFAAEAVLPRFLEECGVTS